MKIDHRYSAGLFLLVAIIICFISGREFLKMKVPDKVYPSVGITKISDLAEYNPNLKGTNGNSAVYYYDSGNPGGTFLLLGGTHPNEPAGFISALLMAENLKVSAGKIIIIPQACYSGFTCTDPLEGCPEFYSLITKSGRREFRFGSRVSNPLDQWPDPLVYSHFPSGQELSGFETRNLNRSYPGRINGSFTEKVAFAIIELIKKEKVDIAIDLHEAAPEVQIINALITHEKGKDIVKEKETPKSSTTRINSCFNCCYNKILACYNYTADGRLCIAEKQNCDATCNSEGTSPSSWRDCWS